MSAIRPHFDADPAVKRWEVDIASPDKTLTVESENVDRGHVNELLGRAGYQVTGEVEPATTTTPSEPPTSLYPLILIVAYLVGVCALIEVTAGGFQHMRAMNNFMAGFFLVFSFFKLLDLPAFAESYAMYDVLARRSRAYALAYPFIELALGAAYVTRFQLVAVNAITLVLMLVGTIGVLQSLLSKQQIRCACLGAVFNLPMSYVTLFEDLLMAGMAAWMLIN